jgi:conjugal transfer pilus assembly protein TraE
MTPERHAADIRDLKRALLRDNALCLLLAAVALTLAIALLGKRETVILEPPTRTSRIAVVGSRVDGAWLKEMGTYVAHMMLDATPKSVAWQHEEILNWVHPSAHGALRDQMAVAAKRLAEANATTMFWPQQVAPDPERQRVALMGTFETYVNGMRVDSGSRSRAYMVGFESRGGRMLIRNWAEVPLDDPWLTKQAEREAAAAKADEKAARKAARKTAKEASDATP